MPSKSKSQQRLMGAAYSYTTGQTKDIPEEVKKVARSFMKQGKRKGKKSLRDFAKTNHKNLPQQVKENKYIKSFALFESKRAETFETAKKMLDEIYGVKDIIKFTPNYSEFLIDLQDFIDRVEGSKPHPLFIDDVDEEDDNTYNFATNYFNNFNQFLKMINEFENKFGEFDMFVSPIWRGRTKEDLEYNDVYADTLYIKTEPIKEIQEFFDSRYNCDEFSKEISEKGDSYIRVWWD